MLDYSKLIDEGSTVDSKKVFESPNDEGEMAVYLENQLTFTEMGMLTVLEVIENRLKQK